MDDAKAREAELVALCVDLPADPTGRWHAKDQLAHLAYWRNESARMVELARTGGEAPPGSNDDTATNAVVYEQTKDRSAAEIKRDAETSWSALRAAIEASSEADLTRPHPQYPESQVWESVPGMGGHLGAHLMSWFMDSGDIARAEAAAHWGHDFECSLLPEGEKRVDALYNLACFYARAGRVDEALPLLRQSIPLRGEELVAWARQDPDLAGIRDDPRVKALLGA